jgi:hypothetical protein
VAARAKRIRVARERAVHLLAEIGVARGLLVESPESRDADRAAEMLERLWLALLGKEETQTATQQIIARNFTLMRRVKRLADAGRECRAAIEQQTPGALDGVSDEAFAAAFGAKDAKEGIAALLQAAGMPASPDMIEKLSRGA